MGALKEAARAIVVDERVLDEDERHQAVLGGLGVEAFAFAKGKEACAGLEERRVGVRVGRREAAAVYPSDNIALPVPGSGGCLERVEGLWRCVSCRSRGIQSILVFGGSVWRKSLFVVVHVSTV